jgi:hypothetical protein
LKEGVLGERRRLRFRVSKHVEELPGGFLDAFVFFGELEHVESLG